MAAMLRQRRPLFFSVSATTRPRRPSEVDGVHYLFIQTEEFDQLVAAGAFLEWAVYNDHKYGTLLGPVEDRLAAGQDVLLEIDVQGAAQLRELTLPMVMFFVVPPSMEELERRLRRRGDTTEDDIKRRRIIAEAELALAPDMFDHIVINDHLERCVTEIDALMSGGCPPERRYGTRQARDPGKPTVV